MDGAFSPAYLGKVLRGFPASTRYCVAYSGGVDSHALLHALAALEPARSFPTITAVHINHGLHREAGNWERHCAEVCNGLRIPLQILRVQACPNPGESPEAAARRARYQALRPLVRRGEMLLTAHHQDDQAETLLLQLFRGAGPAGLAAMPAYTPFGEGWLGRPLLDVPRTALERYGRTQALNWVVDSSNADTRYDRNFVRHAVLPTLRPRWPSVARTIARAAANLRDVGHLLDALAQSDCEAVAGPRPGTLSRTRLIALPAERQRNALRFWLWSKGLPIPGRSHLERILHDVLASGEDANPCVHWPGVEVRRFRDALYGMRPVPPAAESVTALAWDLRMTLELPQGRLEARPAQGLGLAARWCEGRSVEVRFRRGGERCRPAGDRHARKVKKLLQEHDVPPWDRNRLPFVYLDGVLAAVADLWVCDPFAARVGEPGWQLCWKPTRERSDERINDNSNS